jgi:acylphosphatase
MTAREIAAGHQVTGWVRNEPDRSVSLEVQGQVEEIEAFLTALREVMGRTITRETASKVGLEDAERGFVIRR